MGSRRRADVDEYVFFQLCFAILFGIAFYDDLLFASDSARDRRRGAQRATDADTF